MALSREIPPLARHGYRGGGGVCISLARRSGRGSVATSDIGGAAAKTPAY